MRSLAAPLFEALPALFRLFHFGASTKTPTNPTSLIEGTRDDQSAARRGWQWLALVSAAGLLPLAGVDADPSCGQSLRTSGPSQSLRPRMVPRGSGGSGLEGHKQNLFIWPKATSARGVCAEATQQVRLFVCPSQGLANG
jgi:hypothetical protein